MLYLIAASLAFLVAHLLRPRSVKEPAGKLPVRLKGATRGAGPESWQRLEVPVRATAWVTLAHRRYEDPKGEHERENTDLNTK